MKIRKNDTVMVVSGNARGKTGKVLKVYPDRERIIVEGVNIIKRHTRPNQKNPQGGDCAAGGDHPCVERYAGRPEDQRGHTGRHEGREGRDHRQEAPDAGCQGDRRNVLRQFTNHEAAV